MELLTVPPLLCYRCSWMTTKTNSKSSISPPEHLQWLQMEGRYRDLRRCYHHLANGSDGAARSHYGARESLGWVEAKTYTLTPRWWFTSAEQQERKKEAIIYCLHSRIFCSSQTNQTDRQSVRRQNLILTMDFSLSHCVSIMCEIYL